MLRPHITPDVEPINIGTWPLSNRRSEHRPVRDLVKLAVAVCTARVRGDVAVDPFGERRPNRLDVLDTTTNSR